MPITENKPNSFLVQNPFGGSEEDVSLGQVLGSALSLESPPVSSSVAAVMNPDLPAEPEWTLEKFKENVDKLQPGEAEYIDALGLAGSQAEFDNTLAEIRFRKNRRKDVEEAGGIGLAATFASALVSPTTFIPAAGLASGIARSALRTGASASGAAALDELALTEADPTRTGLESGFAIGGSAILGGILGGAMRHMSDVAVAQAVEDIENPMSGSSAGAQGIDPGSSQGFQETKTQFRVPESVPVVGGKTFRPVDKVAEFASPFVRSVNDNVKAGKRGLKTSVEILSQFDNPGRATIAEVTDDPLSKLGLSLRANSGGMLLGLSRAQEDSMKAAVIELSSIAYRKYLGSSIKNIERTELDALSQSVGFKPPKGKVGLTEFAKDIFYAANNNHKGRLGIPEVDEASRLQAEKVLDPLRERLVADGHITEEDIKLSLEASGTETYISHVWNKAFLRQNQATFQEDYIEEHFNRFMEGLQERVDTKLAEAQLNEQSAADLRLSPEEQDALREQLKEELKEASTGQGARELFDISDLQRQAKEFRAAAKRATDPSEKLRLEERSKELSTQVIEAKKNKPSAKETKQQKAVLEKRLANLNKSYSAILGKSQAAWDRIQNNQSDILGRLDRVIKRSDKFLRDFDKASPEKKEALVEKTIARIEREEAAILRHEETIRKLASKHENLREQIPEAAFEPSSIQANLLKQAGVPLQDGALILRTATEQEQALKQLSEINSRSKLPSGEPITPEIRSALKGFMDDIRAADTGDTLRRAQVRFDEALGRRARAEDTIAKRFEELRAADDFDPEAARAAILFARDEMMRKAQATNVKRQKQIDRLKNQLTSPAPAKFFTKDGKSFEFEEGIIFVEDMPTGAVELRSGNLFVDGKRVEYSKRPKKGARAVSLESPVEGSLGVRYEAKVLGEVDSHIPAVKGDGRLDPDFFARSADDLEAKAQDVRADLDRELDKAISRDELGGRVDEILDTETGTLKPDGVRELLRREADFVSQKILSANSPAMNKDGLEIEAVVGMRAPMKRRLLSMGFDRKEKYLVTDHLRVLSAYLRKTVPDIELKKRFGDVSPEPQLKRIDEEAQKIREEIEADETLGAKEKNEQLADLVRRQTSDKDNVKLMFDRMRYLRDVPTDPDGLLRRTGESVLRSANFLYLGGTAAASIPDMAQAVVRYGLDSWLKDGLLNTLHSKGLRAEMRRLAAQAGVGLNSRTSVVTASFNDVGDVGSPTTIERIIEDLSIISGKVALFTYQDDWFKVYAAAQARGQLMRALEQVMTGKQMMSAKAAREVLSRAGINDDMAQRMWAQLRKQAQEQNGNPDAFRRTKSGAIEPDMNFWNDSAVEDILRAHVWHEANTMVVTPGIADMPEFADRNLGFKLLMSVRSFMFSSTNKILASSLAKADKDVLIGFVMASGLASLSYYAWAASFGFDSQQWEEAANADWAKLADEITARNGYWGLLQEARNILATNSIVHGITTFSDDGTDKKQFFNDTLYKLAGVNGSTFKSVDQVFASLVPGPTDQTARAMGKLIPFNNVTYLRGLIDVMQEEAERQLPSRAEALN